MAHADSVEKCIERDRTRGISADQVSLDRGVNRTVEAYAADREAIACRVDDIASAGCAATNCDSSSFLDIDSNSRRADRCRPRGIGAEITALHHCAVAIVQDQGVPAVASDHVAHRRQGAADGGAACKIAPVAHLDRSTVTNHRCAVGIRAKEIACHNVVVAADEDQCLVCVSDAREAESLDSGTGTIAAESAYRGRTKLDHSIASGITDDLDLDLRVVADSERVRACARLGVAIDDHRLIECHAEVTRSAKAISERDRANVRRRVAARIARRDIERDEVRRPRWRRIRVRRVGRLPQCAICTASRSACIGCRCYGECHGRCRRRRWRGSRTRRVCHGLVWRDRRARRRSVLAKADQRHRNAGQAEYKFD